MHSKNNRVVFNQVAIQGYSGLQWDTSEVQFLRSLNILEVAMMCHVIL